MTHQEWFKEQEENGFYHDYYGSEAGFDAGVQIERERIHKIISEMPESTSPSFAWVCDKIVEAIDVQDAIPG